MLVVTNENYYNQYLDNAYVNPTASPKYNPKFRQKITGQQTIKNKKVLSKPMAYKDQRLREKNNNDVNYNYNYNNRW